MECDGCVHPKHNASQCGQTRPNGLLCTCVLGPPPQLETPDTAVMCRCGLIHNLAQVIAMQQNALGRMHITRWGILAK